ncbi:MAG: helix-turn-helix domain-containing protein [Pirellulaceae bacterium]
MLLNEFEIVIPPLQSRSEDLPMIIRQLLEELALELNKSIPRISDSTIEWLLEHDWRGNLNELSDTLREMLQCVQIGDSPNGEFKPEHLPERIQLAVRHGRLDRQRATPIDLEATLQDLERDYILRAMQQTGNNKTQAAKLLGLNRARFLRRCEQLNVEETELPIDFVQDDDIEFMDEGT